MNLRRPRNNKRRGIELLEARECPAVAITAGNNTNLRISGSSTNLLISQEGVNSFRVVDSGADKGVYSTALDLVIALGAGSDSLTLDLNGFTTPRDVKITTGAGANTVVVREGTIARDLTITGGAVVDAVTIGNAVDVMKINGQFNVSLGGGLDSLTVSDKVTAEKDAKVNGANTVVFQNGSSVMNDLLLTSDARGTTVTLAGLVNHDVRFTGTRSTALESLSLTDLAVINHDLIANTDNVGAGNGGRDTLNLAGRIDGDLRVNTAGGNDTVTLAATLVVGSVINVQLGQGADTLVHAVTPDPGHVGTLDGGLGSDTLTLTTALPTRLTKVRFEL